MRIDDCDVKNILENTVHPVKYTEDSVLRHDIKRVTRFQTKTKYTPPERNLIFIEIFNDLIEK